MERISKHPYPNTGRETSNPDALKKHTPKMFSDTDEIERYGRKHKDFAHHRSTVAAKKHSGSADEDTATKGPARQSGGRASRRSKSYWT
jgi:hypothetical protein